MPEMREKNGIIYFDKPYKTTLVSWVLEHELCDSLVLDKEELIDGGCDEWIYVRCYARSREYNNRLYSDVYSEPPAGSSPPPSGAAFAGYTEYGMALDVSRR